MANRLDPQILQIHISKHDSPPLTRQSDGYSPPNRVDRARSVPLGARPFRDPQHVARRLHGSYF